MSRHDVWKMVKRRCEAAELPDDICNQSFRATGITIHQQRGGDIQEAAKLAGHKNVRTTQLYNRAGRESLAPRSNAFSSDERGLSDFALAPVVKLRSEWTKPRTL